MKNLFLLSAFALAAPVAAQTAAPASTNAAQPTAATQSGSTSTSSQPSTTSTGQTGATAPEGSATPAAPASNPADAVAQVVSTDWSKYDADTNDALSKEEFGSWMTALREQNPAQKAQVKDPVAWNTAAFAQADKDKNGSVSKTELQGFLKG